MMRRAAIHFTTIVSLLVATSGTGTIADEPQATRVLDKRTAKDTLRSFQLIFCARPVSVGEKTVGHSWIFFVEGDASGPKQTRALGFWPIDAAKAMLLKTVDGKLLDELLDGNYRDLHKQMTCRLIVQVDEDVFRAANRRAQAWKTAQPKYNLAAHNCNYFAADIAREIEIVPSDFEVDSADKPTTFLQKLIRNAQ